MKRIGLLSVMILLLVATFCFAQVARNPSYNFEGKTNLANVSVQGLDVSGNVGYLEMVGCDGLGEPITYYIYVDSTGDLRLASYAVISAFASFPTGDWSLDNMNVGVVVGSQS